ncbi:MAG: formylglycine-generating enzyme family protein [Chloroflexi bacterium]|nr:formylglycine-generating enzyme family protein [Chloroflexota bacterium]
MQKFNLFVLIFMLALTACAPASTPVPPTPTRIPPTPTLAPLDLSAPMEVGSNFTYIDGASLVAVPAGPFIMGDSGTDNYQHTVTLGAFWIYANKVTNQQYAACVAQGQCTPPNQIDNLGYNDFASRNDPVVGVTYNQAAAYCNFVNGSLPTEAQWEKAARGPDGNQYPWGKDDPSCDLLNFNNCVGQSTDVTKYPKGKSYYGAFDMEGNVFEWVADWYDALYYKSSPSQDPAGPDTGGMRVIRSSSYRSNPGQVAAYTRFFTSPADHRRDLGFRCVITDPTYYAPYCQLVSMADASQLSSVTADCPVISIDSVAQTCPAGGGAIVTFKDDHPNDPNASFGGIGGCKLISGTPGSYPLQFKCTNASTAVMTSSCTYTGIENTTCPAHYQLDASTGICQWIGGRTTGLDCTPGNYYDPVHHCCINVSGAGPKYPNCPVGTVQTEDTKGHFVCLPSGSALNVPAQSASVNPPVCAVACSLDDNICSQKNLVFCSTLCTCISVGVKCPTHIGP